MPSPHLARLLRSAAITIVVACASIARAEAQTAVASADDDTEAVPAPPPSNPNPNPNVPPSVVEFPQPIAPLPRTHAFYFRETLGLAGWHARFAPDTHLSSLTGGLDSATAAGFGLTPNVVLFAEFVGTGGGYDRSSAGYVVSTYSLGPGVAYLWLEEGFYVSTTIAPALGLRIYKSRENGEDHVRVRFTNLGASFNALVGKEWQIADLPLGLGAAFFVRYAVLKQGNFDAFGISASLTYY